MSLTFNRQSALIGIKKTKLYKKIFFFGLVELYLASPTHFTVITLR